MRNVHNIRTNPIPRASGQPNEPNVQRGLFTAENAGFALSLPWHFFKGVLIGSGMIYWHDRLVPLEECRWCLGTGKGRKTVCNQPVHELEGRDGRVKDWFERLLWR